jgi:hypothetical protein
LLKMPILPMTFSIQILSAKGSGMPEFHSYFEAVFL